MEENDLKSTCGGTSLEFEIEKDEKNLFQIWHVAYFFIQNLRKWRKFISKSDVLYFFQFKVWHIMNFSNENHAL